MSQSKVILTVLQENKGKWFLPQDFMRNKKTFVGYEASARMSELAKKYTENIQSRLNGRQLERRWVNVKRKNTR